MMISDPYLKKRGRPKKQTTESILEAFSELTELTEDFSKNTLMLSYQKEHKDFIQFKDQQVLFLMLKRISNSEKIFFEFKAQPILRLLIDTAQELMLDLFEVTVFGIYMERFGWEEHLLPIHDLMLFVGYCAKKHLGSPLDHISQFLSRKIKGFEARFNSWEEKFSDFLEVSIIEINETFNLLSKDNFDNLVNYNFYVDEILQISPPYQIDAKEGVNKRERKERPREAFHVKLEMRTESVASPVVAKNEINFLPYQINSDGIFSLITSVCSEYMQKNNIEEIRVCEGVPAKNKNSFLSAIAFS